jgi:hypothetical protein
MEENTKTEIKRIKSMINFDTERLYIHALREYYKKNYRYGKSDELFFLWIKELLDTE